MRIIDRLNRTPSENVIDHRKSSFSELSPVGDGQ
jgi:hypothetical protein